MKSIVEIWLRDLLETMDFGIESGVEMRELSNVGHGDW